MATTTINKIIYGDKTLIDLSLDDVKASDVASGKKFHLPSGATATGTNTYDATTTDATAIAGDIITGKTAYVNKAKVTGTMPNNGAVSGTISTVAGQYTVPAGYHDGTGKVGIVSTEQSKIIAGNIKSGVQILGVTGTYAGEVKKGQAKSATPYTNKAQTILPDSSQGYDYLTQVTVAQIAYAETENAAGGLTVTIGTVSPT